MTTVDRVLATLPSLSFAISEEPFSPEGRENLVHYLLGTQEPWIDRPAARMDFLLREGLVRVHRVLPDPATGEARWAELVDMAKQRANAMSHEAGDLRARLETGSFVWHVRRGESRAQIAQRVWLALVMYNLGQRGLVFDPEGAVLAEGGAFGAPVGVAPDLALELARARRADRFYVATYAHRLRDDAESAYPVELARGRGRMRWYVHEVRVDPGAWRLFDIEPKPVQPHIALVVAGDEHATRAGLPRDYYRDSAFQQAVIDAEDGEFDLTLVLSPRYQVVALDQVVEDDLTWDDLSAWKTLWMTPMNWAWIAHNRLWRICLERKPVPLEPDALTRPGRPVSWGVWRHPESRYQFSIFGHSEAVAMLAQVLRAQAEVDVFPGYTPSSFWEPGSRETFDFDDYALDNILSNLGLEEEARQDLRETLYDATAQADELIKLVFLPAPPRLNVSPRVLASEEILEPVMLLRTSNCDVDQVINELTALQNLIGGEMISFNLLIDAPTRLSASLRIIHAVLTGEEDDVLTLSEQILPPNLHRLVQDRSLDLREERLSPLLAFAESLSALAVLLNDDDRDRLGIWERTFWGAELRYNRPADDE